MVLTRLNPQLLVPDDTVHNGASKYNKTDKKAPILQCTFLQIDICNLLEKIPLQPAPFQKYYGLNLKKTYVDGEMCTTNLSVFFVWFQPKEIFISL